MTKNLTVRYPDNYIKLIESIVDVNNCIYKEQVNKTDVILSLIEYGYESYFKIYVDVLCLYGKKDPLTNDLFGMKKFYQADFDHCWSILYDISHNFELNGCIYTFDTLENKTKGLPAMEYEDVFKL